MRKLILIAGLMVLCFAAKAQTNPEDTSKNVSVPGISHDAIKLTASERLPEYPGGTEALQRFLAENVKYPKMAIDYNIQGRVVVKFYIDTDGSIRNAEIIRGIGGGCDEEALRVVNAMPKWKPGYQDGKPIKVYFTIPINFKK